MSAANPDPARSAHEASTASPDRAAGAPDASAANPDPAQSEPDASAASQWQLIRLRFSKHKLAVASMGLLCAVYFVAVFAEFFSLYPKDRRNVDRIYSPPQLPAFSFKDGFHPGALTAHRDPVTLRSYFMRNPEVVVPLRFFAETEPYRLCGLIPMHHRFIGVDREAFVERYGEDKLNVATFHLTGTDRYGQDVFSRVVNGARINLSIGLIGIAFAFFIGIGIGGVSGYVGGALDNFIQRSIEVLNAFPQLPLWLAIGAVLPVSWSPLQVYFAITVVLSLFGWTGLARVVRGKILSLREEDYATAARLLGAGHRRILFRHLLPGFTSHIVVSLSLSVPGMILGETALSFLDLGLRPPIVSWGVMLQDCFNLEVVANYPWLLMPVVAIITTVLAFNFFGDGLRDAADPYG